MKVDQVEEVAKAASNVVKKAILQENAHKVADQEVLVVATNVAKMVIWLENVQMEEEMTTESKVVEKEEAKNASNVVRQAILQESVRMLAMMTEITAEHPGKVKISVRISPGHSDSTIVDAKR